jgi:predicted phage tail protein
MAIKPRVKSLNDLGEDPVLITKAISTQVKSYTDSKFKDMEQQTTILMGKMLEQIESKFQRIVNDLGKMVSDNNESYSDTLKSLKEDWQNDMRETAKGWKDMAEESKKLYEAKLEDMRNDYGKSLDGIASILKAMPVPQVIVPAEAIKMLPSIVNLPADSIRVENKVEMLPSIVNLPENAIMTRVEVNQSTPNVSINVPENAITTRVEQTLTVPENSIRLQLGPQRLELPENAFNFNIEAPVAEIRLPDDLVHVNVPPSIVNITPEVKALVEVPKRKSRSTKSIIYSHETGRPERIEEEVEEQ